MKISSFSAAFQREEKVWITFLIFLFNSPETDPFWVLQEKKQKKQGMLWISQAADRICFWLFFLPREGGLLFLREQRVPTRLCPSDGTDCSVQKIQFLFIM